MKRPLILAAVVALAIGLFALGLGLRDTAPSTHAQAVATATATPAGTTATATPTATATAAPVATATAAPAATATASPTTTTTTTTTTTVTTGCTATTLGEPRRATGATTDTGLAKDCDTLLALRDKLPQATADNWLNWSRTLPLTSTSTAGAIAQNWDGVTVGTDASGNKRVTELRLTGANAPYYFRGVVAELAKLDALVALHIDAYETPPTSETELAPETSRPTCNATTLGEPRRPTGATTDTDLAKDCDTLLAIEPVLQGTLASGAVPLNWDPTLALTGWDGVEVTGTPKRVTALKLRNESLAGIIPTQIWKLTALTHLDLQNNRLSGVIPTQIGKLVNLTDLYLDHADGQNNQFTGTIPTQMGDMKSLKVLKLQNPPQGLRGGIPPQLGKLSNLEKLDIRHAGRLGGTIPPQLGNLAKLDNLTLIGLGLTGPIPPELGDLTGLKALRLRRNGQLTGAIPNLPALGFLDLRDLGNDPKICVPAGLALPTTVIVHPTGILTTLPRCPAGN